MSMTTLLNAVVEAALEIPDPSADAPAAVKASVGKAIAMVKWLSLATCAAVLAAMGMMVLGGDNGVGGGLSPKMKSMGMNVAIALVIVGGGVQIIQFLS